MAEGKRFELLDACTSVVFKTTAFDRSAIPPYCLNDYVISRLRNLLVSLKRLRFLHVSTYVPTAFWSSARTASLK